MVRLCLLYITGKDTIHLQSPSRALCHGVDDVTLYHWWVTLVSLQKMVSVRVHLCKVTFLLFVTAEHCRRDTLRPHDMFLLKLLPTYLSIHPLMGVASGSSDGDFPFPLFSLIGMLL